MAVAVGCVASVTFMAAMAVTVMAMGVLSMAVMAMAVMAMAVVALAVVSLVIMTVAITIVIMSMAIGRLGRGFTTSSRTPWVSGGQLQVTQVEQAEHALEPRCELRNWR